jgi:AraC family transcriptional activator of pobA
MTTGNPLPLFHLYGDPPDDQAFDFIHVETISSRSSVHDWTIRAHRHRNLMQILLIEKGGGEMVYEASRLNFVAPAAIVVPATVAHGYHFQQGVTEGWVLTFSEDVIRSLGDRSDLAVARLKHGDFEPVMSLSGETEEIDRLATLCAQLYDERSIGRDGYRLAMRSYLALIAVDVARLAASRARTGTALRPSDAIVDNLRHLVEEHFRKERQLSFYADKLAMTADRLNSHVKRATGVTAAHLIRQRVLTEAKRQLVFTTQAIHEIAYDLAFSDPSHFARFFRKQTGTTPQDFRTQSGG